MVDIFYTFLIIPVMNYLRFVIERDQAFKMVLGILCYHIPNTKVCKKLLVLQNKHTFSYACV